MSILSKEVVGSVGTWIANALLLTAEGAAILGTMAAVVVFVWILLGTGP